MFIIPVQELDDIVNDHFESGDAQAQSINDEAELQEQPRVNDVDEGERDVWVCLSNFCLSHQVLNVPQDLKQSKKISNDQKVIQSDPIPHPALKIKREITKYINWRQFTKGTRGKPNEQLFPK